MNDTETHTPAQGSDMEWQVEALQRQVFLLLLALIVVAATVVFYLYYQSRVLTNDLNKLRPEAMQVIQTYNNNARSIENFQVQVVNYGANHPAFQPILKKYGLPTSLPAK